MKNSRRTPVARYPFTVDAEDLNSFTSEGEIIFDRKNQTLLVRFSDIDQFSIFSGQLQYRQRIILTPPHGEAIKCFLTRMRGSDGVTEFTPTISPIRISDGRALSHVSFALTNFGRYEFWGMPGRSLNLTFNDWEISLIPCSENSVQFSLALQSKKYRLTHAGTINRADRSTFSVEAFESLSAGVPDLLCRWMS